MPFQVTRRDALIFGVAGGASVTFGLAAFARELSTQKAIEAFIDDVEVDEGKIVIDAPEIAEDGHSVPIEVSVESAMDGDDVVREILILADENPDPTVGTFKFGALSGEARASTRIRLAQSQKIFAFARMEDGKIYRASHSIKVTIGGCGG